MLKQLEAVLEAEGMRVAAASCGHLAELKTEFDNLYDSGAVGAGLRETLSSRFRWELPEGLNNMQTILCVAMPSPIGRAVFSHEGATLTVSIPPTYRDYVKTPPVIESKLNETLCPYGFKAHYTRNLPLKLLAVRSGLARYGRNNIAYIEGMGSFVFLSSYFTDMPCEGDAWGEAKRMDLCDTCGLCVKSCPTGAIRADTRVIDAERCLTMHNEKDSAVPFPEWVGPAAHNSLVGCLACQLACPMNRDVLSYQSEPVEFDGEETELMLKGTPVEQLPAETVIKMEKLSIETYYEVVPRNLEALLCRRHQ